MTVRRPPPARKGLTPGPSGMTCEHLRPPLNPPRFSFSLMGEQLAQGVAPEASIHAVRVGRLTVLQKPDGGARGIVAGDVVRRLIARTMAQQMSDAVKVATSPYQYALSIRARCECISHVLQCLTELENNATVVSIDCICAFNLISQGAMLQALLDVYGEGVVHEIDKGEGGEQGDNTHAFAVLIGATRSAEGRSATAATWRVSSRLLGWTFTSLPHRTGFQPCTTCCKRNCGDTQESRCTMAKQRCGTSLE